jgi:hypothetical protein
VLNEPSGGFGSPGTGPRGESELLQEFRSNLQQKNKLLRSFIGMGYYGTITPAVIQRYIYTRTPCSRLDHKHTHTHPTFVSFDITPFLFSRVHSQMAACVLQEHAGEPRLVHPVHALPGRNRPGPPREPPQLPDHGTHGTRDTRIHYTRWWRWWC